MSKIKRYFKRAIELTPLWAKISLCLGVISAVLYLIFILSPTFSDFFNRYPAAFLRWLLSVISGVFPFSLAETVVMLSPMIFIAVIIKIFKVARKGLKDTFKMFVSMLSVLSLILTTFSFLFAAGYRGSTLDKKLGLERTAVSAAELKSTAGIVLEELVKLEGEISYAPNGSSLMPYSFFEMDDKLQDAYIMASEKYDFLPSFKSSVKPIILSEPMTYTHISGVYTFFTGESNVNTNFPDYCLPYTAAHELAHQRGIAREDEANFVAFLVCIESGDPYIRYCGYMGVYEYLLSALYSADSTAYYELINKTSRQLIGEIAAYNAFFDKYRDNVVADVSGTVNDNYLQSQGQSAGSRSYGMVVDLAVAYYKDTD